MAIRAHYTSTSGGFLPGIPARNLSEDEYDALTGDEKRLVRASGLYRIEPEKDAPKPATPKKEGE